MSMIKRVSAGILCLCILLCALPLGASAEAPREGLVIGTAGGGRGDEVTVELSLEDVTGIAGGSFTVYYDNSRLQLVKAEKAELLTGLSSTVNDKFKADAVRVSFAGTEDLAAPGTLARLTFRILSTAAAGDSIPVTAAGVRLYNSDSVVVSTACTEGSVKVYGVETSISSDSCLPGQSLKLALTVGGGLHPSGGRIQLKCNSNLLKMTSVKAVQKLGSIGITASYSISDDGGSVTISWAASEPLEVLGQLCTVIFKVDEAAVGETRVTIASAEYYDENGDRIDSIAPQDGTVTVAEKYNSTATLYIVGGAIEGEGNTSTVRVAIDGAGVVCGGTFTLSYDASVATLKKATSEMASAPNTNTPGTIKCSWAEDGAALDDETVLEMVFETTGACRLTLSDVLLKDKDGRTVSDIRVINGATGINAEVQAPAAEIRKSEGSIGVSAVLCDANFCREGKQTQKASCILAAYDKNGRFISMELPGDAVTFDSNGVAEVSIETGINSEIETLKLFILKPDGSLVPIGENAVLKVN